MTSPCKLPCCALVPWVWSSRCQGKYCFLSLSLLPQQALAGCSCAGQRVLVAAHLPKAVCSEILWIIEVGVRLLFIGFVSATECY